MSKVVKIGAVGDNCMDVYEKEGKFEDLVTKYEYDSNSKKLIKRIY